MRLTLTHLREAALIAAVSLFAFAAIVVADHQVGRDSPFTPGIVSLILVGLWIFLLRRYGPRGPVDPLLQRRWVLSSMAASGVLAVFGLIAAVWMWSTTF